METQKEAVMAAAIAVSLIAIPAAAQSVEISEDGKFFAASSQGSYGSDFQIDFDKAERQAKLQSPNYSASRQVTPNRTVKTYETAQASLKIVYVNASERREELETPYGTLTTGVKNGRRFEKFEGLNRSKVEEIKAEVSEKFDKRITELEERERQAIKESLPEFDVAVHEGDIEYVNITNHGSETVDLSGWRMVSSDETYTDSFTVDSVSIEPGQTYTFYSGKPEDLRTNAVYETGMTLYSSSGVLELYTDQGLKHTVLQYS